MKLSALTRPRRILYGSAILVLLFGAALAFVALVNDSTPHTSTSDIHTPPHPLITAETPAADPTTDPIQFARSTAQTLFRWDTTQSLTWQDYQSRITDSANHNSDEINGLLTDVEQYLPTLEQWQRLREMGTRQHLEITDAVIPDQWAEALEQGKDQIAPGTVAVTIDGIRHREGTWLGEDASTASPVSFTVFVVCAPTADPCQILRLSAVNKPLR